MEFQSLDDFTVIRTLGRGAFARCLLARRKKDGTQLTKLACRLQPLATLTDSWSRDHPAVGAFAGYLYAIKQFLSPFSELPAKEQKEAVDEVCNLAKLDSPYVVRYVPLGLRVQLCNA